MKQLTRVTCVSLIGLACARATGQCQYEAIIVEPLDCPSGSSLLAFNINAQGVVAARARCFLGPDHAAIVRADGAVEIIGFGVPVIQSRATGIDNQGRVVGRIEVEAGVRSYLFQDGAWEDLGDFRGSFINEAQAINDDGWVVGRADLQAVVWRDGGVFPVDGTLGAYASEALDINDHGQILGWIKQESGPGGADVFLSHAGEIEILERPPGQVINVIDLAISDAGVVVGILGMAVGEGLVPRSYRWIDGHPTEINDAFVFDINASGVIVGKTSGDESGRGFVAYGDASFDLAELSDSPLPILAGISINNAGQIAGQAEGANDLQLVILTPLDAEGDVTGDCRVRFDDLLVLLRAWGERSSPADLNDDRIVDQGDLVILLENWDDA